MCVRIERGLVGGLKACNFFTTKTASLNKHVFTFVVCVPDVENVDITLNIAALSVCPPPV
jgi:hypothetical protein